MASFIDRNSTDFPLSLEAGINKLLLEWDASGFLKKHQYAAVHYMMNNPAARGLYVIHGMGWGKTVLAAALAWNLKKKYKSWKVILVAPLTLQENFRHNLEKFARNTGVGRADVDAFMADYRFVPLNSGVMFRKLKNAGKTDEVMALEKQLEAFQSFSADEDFLENSIVIVDEFHHLSNGITNGSRNALAFYDAVMRTKRIKLFALSGTPIMKHPFELVPAYNMLAANPTARTPPLLPEIFTEFCDMFISADGKSPAHADVFTNRIMGLTSYAGPLFSDGIPDGFPELLPMDTRRIPMSMYQWHRYAIARAREKDMNSSQFQRVKASQQRFGHAQTSSTYRVESRQASNFVFPEFALDQVATVGLGGLDSTRPKGNPEKLTDVVFADMKKYSPKMQAIYEEIISSLERGERRILLYSDFTSSSTTVFAKYLIYKGWQEWLPPSTGGAASKSVKPKTADDGNDTKGATKAKDDTKGITKAANDSKVIKQKRPDKAALGELKFVRVTGQVAPEDRDLIKDHFNATDEVQLFMISRTGTEGLSLYRGRVVLIMEPYWHYERIMQAIHRFYRYQGHVDLPEAERKVRPVIFLSVPPEGLKDDSGDFVDGDGKSLVGQLTTDEHLWDQSSKQKVLNDKFLQLPVESSIDCAANYPHLSASVRKRIHCKSCAPTHKKLFHDDIADDFKYPNPCKPVETKAITAKEIVLDGDIKYYYTGDPNDPAGAIQIYMYDPFLSGYVVMPTDHPHYSAVYAAILK